MIEDAKKKIRDKMNEHLGGKRAGAKTLDQWCRDDKGKRDMDPVLFRKALKALQDGGEVDAEELDTGVIIVRSTKSI